ncbi:ATP binding protein [Aspergillus sp. HF37]|nr:ATP binding protein [Aspergillus sp. HF37]
MPFAQLVIGPPGSGKSTYCNGMHQFLSAIGRKCSIVNLDPANDQTSYPCALDVRDLITLEEIMREDSLGPNGGVLYALEELEENFDWIERGLGDLGDDYVLFDCPGQVELFTHHSSLRNIFFKIQKLGYRLIVIHLIDSYNLTLPSMYISALLVSLRAMLQMDLPHLNVLTKIDNLANYAPSPSTSTSTPTSMTSTTSSRTSTPSQFGLVAFETLAVEDKRSMMNLLRAVDRASGYAFGPAEGANDSVWQVAVREGMGTMDVRDVQERWLDAREEYDEAERHELEAEAKAREEESQRAAHIPEELAAGPPPPPDGGVKVRRK